LIPVLGWEYLMSSDEHPRIRYDLGNCSALYAESVGEPGNRYFRLRAIADEGLALLWLEKEQLHQLAVAIKELLKTEIRMSDTVQDGIDATGPVDFDFKVARLAIGQDSDSTRYVILARVIGDDNDEQDEDDEMNDGSIALWADLGQLDSFADQAFQVCSGGRPRCPLCGAAINQDKQHVCVRSNGHSHQ
jgi:uncharacterized repeat protein (TIGR03847 family)